MGAITVTVTESGDGPYAQTVTAGGHVLRADEPENVGGQDLGPSPYEFLMAGLGACTAMTLRAFALRQKWSVGRISITLRHAKIVMDGTDGLTDRFDRDIAIAGSLSEEQKNRLLHVAETCPVSLTLRHSSVVTTKLT